MKTCTKCGVPKEEGEFYVCSGKRRSRCKTCEIKISAAWNLRNPEKVKENGRNCLHNNPEPNRRRSKEYRAANLNKIRGHDRERSRIKSKTLGARKARRENRMKRYREDPKYRTEVVLRARLGAALKANRAGKIAKTFELLGCPWVWLEVHLESLFTPGMTWENQGPVWHIDHIKPCAKFDLADPEQQRICFHWTNLQPLLAEDNFRKSGSYSGS